jgi:hypothetical protein
VAGQTVARTAWDDAQNGPCVNQRAGNFVYCAVASDSHYHVRAVFGGHGGQHGTVPGISRVGYLPGKLLPVEICFDIVQNLLFALGTRNGIHDEKNGCLFHFSLILLQWSARYRRAKLRKIAKSEKKKNKYSRSPKASKGYSFGLPQQFARCALVVQSETKKKLLFKNCTFVYFFV